MFKGVEGERCAFVQSEKNIQPPRIDSSMMVLASAMRRRAIMDSACSKRQSAALDVLNLGGAAAARPICMDVHIRRQEVPVFRSPRRVMKASNTFGLSPSDTRFLFRLGANPHFR